jgi:hypothetical protein
MTYKKGSENKAGNALSRTGFHFDVISAVQSGSRK